MKSILVGITCNHCMYQTHKRSETLVMSDFEPQLREQLLNNMYFQMRCPQCGNLLYFQHPFCYVDKKHQFVILMKSKADITEKDLQLFNDRPNMRKRLVFHFEEIAEKIRIFENELDDRIIEKIKRSLYQRYKNARVIEFYDMDKQSDTIWFRIIDDESEEMVCVLLDSYRNLYQKLEKDDMTFKEINLEWAIKHS